MAEDEETTQLTGLAALPSPPKAAARTKDILAFYLAEVRRHPLLDPETEREYAIAYLERGDPEAARKLVTSNLRLVIKIAFQYHRQWANVLDLIQEGNVGLVEALSRYDPYREIRFSSYAQYWIRAMIRRFLLDNYRMVRLGSSRAGRKLFYQLQKERDRLIEQGLDPTPKLLAERLGVKESEVHAVDQHLRAPALSFDAPVSTDDTGRLLSEVVSADDEWSPEEDAARHEMGNRVRDRLAQFEKTLTDDRERRIWNVRLMAAEQASLSELGKEFDVSKERIRQVEARIKKRLKAFLEQELGPDIDYDLAGPGDEETV
jgi:RNA polymerase sigma-32 factor